MKYCKVCGMHAADEAAKCGSCGEAFELPEHLAARKPAGGGSWLLVIIVLAGAVLGYLRWQRQVEDENAVLAAECRRKCAADCRQLSVGQACEDGADKLERCVLDCRNGIGSVVVR